MNSPLVSIIIPIFNVENYLERCIKSVQNQTYKNLQILAINDGSTDKSLKILKRMQKNDKRISIINKENGGQASARNLGIKKAVGEYLMMLDGDDFLTKEAVKSCVEIIQEHEYDLIIFDYLSIGYTGRKRYVEVGDRMNNSESVAWNKFYKKNLWDDCYFPEGYWYEDLGIVPIIVAKSENVFKLNKPLYIYDTSRINSQTNSLVPSKLLDVITMIENVNYKLKEMDIMHSHVDEFKNLVFEHLVNIVILNKIINIKNRNCKKQLIYSICCTLDKHFPDWKKYHLDNDRLVERSLKKIALYCYLKGFFFIGNIIWKYPKKIKIKIFGY